MKLLTRAQFLELPEGVFYAKNPQEGCDGTASVSMIFGDLEIKHETYRDSNGRAIDWRSQSLNMYDNHGDSDIYERLVELRSGGSVPLCDYTTRDGLFDEDDMFLVYERADLEALAKLVEAAKAVTP